MTDTQAWRLNQVREAGLNAVVSVLPHHVLMLTGYRPRLGSGVALVLEDGTSYLCVPSDEIELARAAGAMNVSGYETVTLEQRVSPERAITAKLLELQSHLPAGARVGYEDGSAMAPNAYVSSLQFGESLPGILSEGLPSARLEPAAGIFRVMQSRKTDTELAFIRDACELGRGAFLAAYKAIAPGRTEQQVAAAALAALAGADFDGVSKQNLLGSEPEDRGGQVWVMSGPNSALAYRAFAQTSTRRIEQGDLVLVHMNPQLNGFWSDLTRTFVVGQPSARCEEIISAVLDARGVARSALRNGITGRSVDAAARARLTEHGFGPAFKHQTGHGVGFNGISGLDSPSLHPLSSDVLEPGMCFNVEPAVYIDGFGGYRHCDVLAMGPEGPVELSPYLVSAEELTIND